MTTTYTKFNKLTDSQKQNMTQEFIRDISIINQNTVVEYILSKSSECCEAPFSYDDISNNEPTGQIKINGAYYELDSDERDEKLEFYERLRDKADNIHDYFNELVDSECDSDEYKILDHKLDKALNLSDKYTNICDKLESMGFNEYPEIYQWFECDSYLLRRLEERGECILDNTYWGRKCCGQSIALDSVIQKIAYDHYTENTGYNITPENLNFLITK